MAVAMAARSLLFLLVTLSFNVVDGIELCVDLVPDREVSPWLCELAGRSSAERGTFEHGFSVAAGGAFDVGASLVTGTLDVEFCIVLRTWDLFVTAPNWIYNAFLTAVKWLWWLVTQTFAAWMAALKAMWEAYLAGVAALWQAPQDAVPALWEALGQYAAWTYTGAGEVYKFWYPTVWENVVLAAWNAFWPLGLICFVLFVAWAIVGIPACFVLSLFLFALFVVFFALFLVLVPVLFVFFILVIAVWTVLMAIAFAVVCIFFILALIVVFLFMVVATVICLVVGLLAVAIMFVLLTLTFLITCLLMVIAVVVCAVVFLVALILLITLFCVAFLGGWFLCFFLVGAMEIVVLTILQQVVLRSARARAARATAGAGAGAGHAGDDGRVCSWNKLYNAFATFLSLAFLLFAKLFEFFGDLAIVNASFRAFMILTHLHELAYVRDHLIRSLLETVSWLRDMEWFQAIMSFVEDVFLWASMRAQLMYNFLNFECPGAAGTFSAFQLLVGLSVMYMLLNDDNLIPRLTKILYDAGDHLVLMPAATFIKMVLFKTFEVMVSSVTTFIWMVRPPAEKPCDFEGDIIATIVGMIMLWTVGILALVFMPLIATFSTPARDRDVEAGAPVRRMDAVFDFVFGSLSEPSHIAGAFRKFVPLTVGFWTEEAMKDATRPIAQKQWFSSANIDRVRCELYIFLCSDFACIGYNMFPLGAVLAKVMQSVNEGFVWTQCTDKVPEPSGFALTEKALAWLRVIFIIIIPLVPVSVGIWLMWLAVLGVMIGMFFEQKSVHEKSKISPWRHEAAEDTEAITGLASNFGYKVWLAIAFVTDLAWRAVCWLFHSLKIGMKFLCGKSYEFLVAFFGGIISFGGACGRCCAKSCRSFANCLKAFCRCFAPWCKEVCRRSCSCFETCILYSGAGCYMCWRAILCSPFWCCRSGFKLARSKRGDSPPPTPPSPSAAGPTRVPPTEFSRPADKSEPPPDAAPPPPAAPHTRPDEGVPAGDFHAGVDATASAAAVAPSIAHVPPADIPTGSSIPPPPAAWAGAPPSAGVPAPTDAAAPVAQSTTGRSAALAPPTVSRAAPADAPPVDIPIDAPPTDTRAAPADAPPVDIHIGAPPTDTRAAPADAPPVDIPTGSAVPSPPAAWGVAPVPDIRIYAPAAPPVAPTPAPPAEMSTCAASPASVVPSTAAEVPKLDEAPYFSVLEAPAPPAASHIFPAAAPTAAAPAAENQPRGAAEATFPPGVSTFVDSLTQAATDAVASIFAAPPDAPAFGPAADAPIAAPSPAASINAPAMAAPELFAPTEPPAAAPAEEPTPIDVEDLPIVI